MKTRFQLSLVTLLLFSATLMAQNRYSFNAEADGFHFDGKSNNTLTIHHNLSALTIETADRDGLQGQFITVSGIHIPNTAGAPDLPSGSTFIAIPNGSTPSIKMVGAMTKTIKDVDLLPAPKAQLDNDDSPASYQKDMAIYGRNAFYPETPYLMSEVMTVRGVQMVQVGVMPFQYNPVTKELIVYEQLDLEVTTEGGDGTYGDIRYRTPEWDQLLSDMLLNRDALPDVDYGERLRKHYENCETGCEYLIITPDNEDFLALADSIKQFRLLQGIPTEIFTVTQCGGNDYTAIRQFIRDAYNTWDMPPAAVLFLGDHDTDPSKGIVSYTMNNHPGGSGYNPYISDHAYSVMSNNHMPDIIVGRITGRDYDELHHMIKKDIDYERTPPTNPGFYDQPVTAMGFQLERWFQLCSEVMNGFWEYGLGKHPVRINAIYEGTPGSRWSTYEHTNTVVNYFGPNGCGYIPSNMSHLTDWSGTGNKVNQAINNGAFIIQHRDHGAEEVWGEPSYGISLIKKLTNEDLTFVMSNNCLTGKFDYNGNNGCFAEAFHRHQHGALGLIAATEVSYSFVNDVYVWGVYDNMWPEFMPSFGTEHPTNFIRPAFGNAAGKFFLRQSSWTDDEVKQITYYLFHQFGDVYMNLYTEMPQHLNVEMLPVITAGSGRYTFKADEGATVCLTVGEQIIGYGMATGNAQELTITPQTPGTRVTLTITKQNYYRYEHELAVIPFEGPYLIFDAIQFNDLEGNDNQAPDYDETCQFHLGIHNVGTEGIDNVQVTLSCPNPEVQILQNKTSYSHFDPDGILTNENAFTVHFGNEFNDGQKVKFYINLSNSDNNFNDSVDVVINAPLLTYTDVSFTDAAGQPTDRLMKGETTYVTFTLTNEGHSKSHEIANHLEIIAPFASVVEDVLLLQDLEAGASSQATFGVRIHDDAPTGGVLKYRVDAESQHHKALREDDMLLGYTMEDFEGDTLTQSLQWILGSNGKLWRVVEDETAQGGHCMRSPELGDNKRSSMMIGIKCAIPGELSFYHKTSTDAGDKLCLYINNKERASWSGESDWEQSSFELEAGSQILKFEFRKDAQGSAGNDCVYIDQISLPPTAELVLFAGTDAESCSEAYTPSSYAYHYKTLEWSSDGDGSFDDKAAERPTYTFGQDDLDSSQVTLTMTGTSMISDMVQRSQVVVSILNDLSTISLDAPVGDAEVDLRLGTQNAYAAETLYDAEILWVLLPEEAGSLTSDGHQVTIDWNEQFRGIATLSYILSNPCGESEPLQALDIHVFNSTGVTEQLHGAIEVYPNPAHKEVTIKLNDLHSESAVIRIIDDLGRTVYETAFELSDTRLETRVNLSNYPNGLYNIQVISGQKTLFSRLLVQ